MKKFRPWGQLDWLLDRVSKGRKWHLLGCLATEERSLSVWNQMNRRAELADFILLKIIDPPSRFDSLKIQRFTERTAEFGKSGGDTTKLISLDLISRHHEIVDVIHRFVDQAGENVMLDISSLPKRYFFPFIAQLLKTNSSVTKNIFVCYTMPRTYTTETLSENHGDWAHLPLFGGGYSSTPVETLVTGVGFEALGLLDELEAKATSRKVKYLLPYPTPMSAHRRSLELLRRLQEHSATATNDVFRVSAHSVSDTFDRLLSLGQSKSLMLAPFGPKPSSLGMALYASLTNAEVFYTQPTTYHPDYSVGVSERNGNPESYCYCLRLNEVDQFALPC